MWLASVMTSAVEAEPLLEQALEQLGGERRGHDVLVAQRRVELLLVLAAAAMWPAMIISTPLSMWWR